LKTSNDSIVNNLIKDPYFHKWIIDPESACLDFWVHWADRSEERQECMERARAILLSYKFRSISVSQAEKNSLWDQITEQIEKPTPIKKMGELPHTTRHLWYGIAAAVILLVMVFFAYNRDWSEPIEVTKSESGFIEKAAPEGKISSFTFQDGTTVKLFSGSVIRYPVNFSEDSREVYLKGEGFFEVKRDTNRPFTVKTNTLMTTALGTSFNIQTYENGSKCNVSLVTGKVRVEMLKNSNGMANTVFLEPGEEAVIKFDGVIKQPFNIQETISWKDGYIYLENKNFDETISILKRWFKVDFVITNRVKIENKLKGKTGNGTFKNQSLENILRIIGHSFEFKYEIKDDTVILTL
jgi:ferric-dicitrate binding protein FerR (iron transport regulator)